ncbi:hypothetical protein [Streptomyces mirabilis]|uniref:hypothetical protein n=1 Tax=Streptomyces mirabilis TaxID=68239 RepID=UPI0033D5AF2D
MAPDVSTAYVTHGRKYHTDPDCPRMLGGEYLHDWDGDGHYDTGFTAGSYRIADPSAQYAAMRGKLPCLHCVPAELRVFPPLYGQTFGHRPVIGFIDGRALTRVCARCHTLRPNGPRFFGTAKEPVRWPCTSAHVLGLVPRALIAA